MPIARRDLGASRTSEALHLGKGDRVRVVVQTQARQSGVFDDVRVVDPTLPRQQCLQTSDARIARVWDLWQQNGQIDSYLVHDRSMP